MKPFLLKATATFIYNAGAILPAASVLGGWPVWKAAITAGASAVVELLIRWAKDYLAKNPGDDE